MLLRTVALLCLAFVCHGESSEELLDYLRNTTHYNKWCLSNCWVGSQNTTLRRHCLSWERQMIQAGISKHPFTVLDQRKLKTSAFCAKPSGKLSHQGVNITDFIPANIRKNQTNYKFHTGQQAVKTNEKVNASAFSSNQTSSGETINISNSSVETGSGHESITSTLESSLETKDHQKDSSISPSKQHHERKKNNDTVDTTELTAQSDSNLLDNNDYFDIQTENQTLLLKETDRHIDTSAISAILTPKSQHNNGIRSNNVNLTTLTINQLTSNPSTYNTALSPRVFLTNEQKLNESCCMRPMKVTLILCTSFLLVICFTLMVFAARVLCIKIFNFFGWRKRAYKLNSKQEFV